MRSFPSIQKYSKSYVTLFFLADLIYKTSSALMILLPDKAYAVTPVKTSTGPHAENKKFLLLSKSCA